MRGPGEAMVFDNIGASLSEPLADRARVLPTCSIRFRSSKRGRFSRCWNADLLELDTVRDERVSGIGISVYADIGPYTGQRAFNSRTKEVSVVSTIRATWL